MHGRPARARRPIVSGALLLAAAGLAAFVLWANTPVLKTSPTAPVEAALRAVSDDPLRVDALRNLGLALDRQGDRAQGAPLMALAGERSKRDTATALWLLQRALEAARYDEAFDQADALLRRDIAPEQRERLYVLLTAAAAVDPARPALARHLAGQPWWRESFLRDLAAKGDPTAGEAVLVALQRAGAGPTPEESQPFLVRRVADGQFGTAAQEGARLFGAGARDPNDLSTPPPIGWSGAGGEGASSATDDGRLSVTYDGFASPDLPRRLLALAPGAWTIGFQHRTPDGSFSRLKVSVRCAQGLALAESAPLIASPTWRSEALAFTVPPTGCVGQWLSILPDPGERRAAVETDFAKWSVTPGASALLPH